MPEQTTGDDLATPINVTTVAYHTIDHSVAHNEGDAYDVSSYGLLQTLVGCGFADITQPQPGGGPVAATGATAGAPGTFTPAGATTPATLAAMASVVATPATAWTTGQFVTLGDASSCYWNATAWTAGTAP